MRQTVPVAAEVVLIAIIGARDEEVAAEDRVTPQLRSRSIDEVTLSLRDLVHLRLVISRLEPAVEQHHAFGNARSFWTGCCTTATC